MKIIKYKKNSNGKYTLYLDDNSKVNLYEETILEYNLLLTKEVIDIDELYDFNMKYEIYYSAIKTLNSRFRSTYELKKILLNKKYDEDKINEVINILIKQGYLNDKSYAKSYINNQIITTNWGPFKIKKELLNKGVKEEIIDEELIIFNDKLQEERVDKIIKKLLKSNHNKGGVVLKIKISNDLRNLGYDYELINKTIDRYEFNVDKDIYEKEYNKLYNKLSNKYSGNELEYKIKEKLYQKGLYKE